MEGTAYFRGESEWVSACRSDAVARLEVSMSHTQKGTSDDTRRDRDILEVKSTERGRSGTTCLSARFYSCATIHSSSLKVRRIQRH